MLQTFGGDLQGPVEAFSKEAAASFAAGFTSCTSVAGWNKQPESQWLSSCASTLGIAAERAPRLLSGYHEEVPRPCDTVHGLFHPFPQVDGMKQCLKQSGYYYIHAPATSTRTSTTTRTTTTSSTITRTSSTATTSTMTYTIAKVAPDSIFNFERRSFQKQLPVWVITAENEHRGIPFAIGLATSLLLLFCIPIVGFFRTTPPAPVPGGTVLPRVAPEEIEDPLLRGP
ncbi:unnamed protein product [Durusdinium trenchii]|uniref:Uncharacterized protein n=1 Tax=Durusdinium trenchii TaxID=1381693 RepID=A0ABP0NEL1_9DINO